MKVIFSLLAVLMLASCSLIEKYETLGPDLGIRVADKYAAFQYVHDNLTYEAHGLNHHMPDYVLANGKGDCLEYSLVVLKILHDSGVEDGHLMYTVYHAWVKLGGVEYDPQSLDGSKFPTHGIYYINAVELTYDEIVNSAWILHLNVDS